MDRRGIIGAPRNRRIPSYYINQRTALCVFFFTVVGFVWVKFSCMGWTSWKETETGVSMGRTAQPSDWVIEGNTASKFTFHDKYSRAWFLRNCIGTDSVGRSISDIYETFKLLENTRTSSFDPQCTVIRNIFKRLLIHFDKIETSLYLPPTFETQVRKWLGNNESLFKQIYAQNVFKVVSELTGEVTLFNTLRSKRPVSSSGIDPVTYIEDLVRNSKTNCDFCSYKNHTAADLFGRVQTRLSATASNTFKLAKFHGLFFPLSHHPVNLTYNQLYDLFVVTSQKWFEKVYEADPTQKYRSLLWDSLPHAGASQVHPHVHGLVDSQEYAGIFETIHHNAQVYFRETWRSVWTDFILLHQVLGLTRKEGNAVAIVPITARKDHEFWIISNELNEDVIKLLHKILLAYKKNLNTFCHSSGIVYPLMGGFEQYIGLPVIFRIGSRGDCTVLRSDVSSLELYTVNNINTNLEETISALESIE